MDDLDQLLADSENILKSALTPVATLASMLGGKAQTQEESSGTIDEHCMEYLPADPMAPKLERKPQSQSESNHVIGHDSPSMNLHRKVERREVTAVAFMILSCRGFPQPDPSQLLVLVSLLVIGRNCLTTNSVAVLIILS
jgi:hypothetical protein